ncbi:MAG: pyruvate, phosphate dikinase [Fusobacteriaceae bacterium]
MEKVILLREGLNQEKELLGGKGKNLAYMMGLKISVPKAVVVTTEACREYFQQGLKLDEITKNKILKGIDNLQKKTEKSFTGENLLLVSVRSGAPVSMPGMMDTILNLGINDENFASLVKMVDDEEKAYEIYIRFIEMFSEIVKGIGREKLKKIKNESISRIETVKKYKEIYLQECGEEFPESPELQILMAVESIFKSWNNERAKIYREINGIDSSMGTAVVIQEMVFGNFNEFSGTGVAFTRNPSTGEKTLFGEYLLKAQGEDIVAGIRTPEKIESLKIQLPEIYQEFQKICEKLENEYKDMQDIEFTIENKKLYILQTRNGKRTPQAALKIAMDLFREGKISRDEAILRINPEMIPQILSGDFCENSLKGAKLLTKGIAGSAGVAVGKIVLDSNRVEKGTDSILLREETSPEDIKGMNLTKGIVTVRGGATSHGAVIARGMGKCCVTGCEYIKIDEDTRTIKIKGETLKEGDIISVNGHTGEIFLGALEINRKELTEEFKEFLKWCKEIKSLNVRANADTPEDIQIAKNFGAEGVGLCRTEHMFFQEERILNVREMIIAENDQERRRALEKLQKAQEEDFYNMMKNLDGAPFNVRLLDPPFHEFLPKTDRDINKLANSLGKHSAEIKFRISELKEENPMLGHRGSRLAVTFPEIYEMQSLALMNSAIKCKKEGISTEVEIMLPFIGGISEFKFIKKNIKEQIESLFAERGERINYKLGTMMELPRACLLADEIGEESDFFSFGTNDLTQTTYGISRDDSSKFINHYMEKNIIKRDPFQSIDKRGVGKLISIAKNLGRESNPKIKIGVCGEHGGDPASIEYFKSLGLDYVSCSPYRVPVAILSAAHSELLNPKIPKEIKIKRIKIKLKRV